MLAPNRKWNGRDKNFEFEILGRVDANYATDPETRKSVTGCITFLEGAPVCSTVQHRRSLVYQ